MSQHANQSRMRLPGVGSLPGAGFLNDRLSDAIVLLSALPEMVVALRAIHEHIERVDSEVTLMRQGVDRLHVEVTGMRTEMQELAVGINTVGASVERLEPHVSDLSRVVRPIKRMRGRANASAGVPGLGGPLGPADPGRAEGGPTPQSPGAHSAPDA